MLRECLTFVVNCDFPGCAEKIVLPRLAGNFLRHEGLEKFILETTGQDWLVNVPPRSLPADLIGGIGSCKCPRHKNKMDRLNPGPKSGI